MTRGLIEIGKRLNKVELSDVGNVIMNYINEDDNNTDDIGKGVIAVLHKCETQREYDIANEMLIAVCGYGVASILAEIEDEGESIFD